VIFKNLKDGFLQICQTLFKEKEMKRQNFSETIGRARSSNNSPMSVVKGVAKKKEITERDVWLLLKVCAYRLDTVHGKSSLAERIDSVAAKVDH
jgi:predicted solute-binding protein